MADLQMALWDLSVKHAENVPFSQQISVLGVTIGSILMQVVPEHRVHYYNLLISNIKNADSCIERVTLN